MVDTLLAQDKSLEGSSNNEVSVGVDQNPPPPQQVNEQQGGPAINIM